MENERAAPSSALRFEDGRDQERLIPFFLDPASHEHHPRGIRLVQTHASFVFLADPFVYKVKKAVNFGFLDFSTLQKRKHFCQRELELNRRLTTGVYLGVVPVTLRDGALSLGGNGEIVEYCVKMRMLPESGFLDRRLARGQVTTADLDRVVTALEEFYTAQHPTSEIARQGRIESLRVSTDENFDQSREFIGKTIASAAHRAISHYTNRFFAEHAELFEQRVRGGRILDCHGDLHLDHVHLTPDALNIFDCIEFNDRFRHVDVANDAAFLAMDLDFRGRPDLSRYLVERLARDLADPGMLRVMDFYKCYRAYVRGKVESLHSVTHAAPQDERAGSAGKARDYFRLALRYAVAGSRAQVVAVMGRVGSGKSTLAAALAAELGYHLFSSDCMRKELAGVPLHERGNEAERARLYSSAMSARTYGALLEAAERNAGGHHGVVLDATYGTRSDRDSLRRRLEQRGIDLVFLEASAPDAVLRRRLAGRDREARVTSDARLEDFEPLKARFDPPSELPAAQFATIDAGGAPAASLAEALRVLVERRVSLA